MSISELFLKAVQHHLSQGATQVAIANHLGIEPQQVNAFMKGRSNFSEDRKERVSAFFGKTYLEMLNLGHRLETGSDSPAPEISVNMAELFSKLEKLDQKDLILINGLASRLSEK